MRKLFLLLVAGSACALAEPAVVPAARLSWLTDLSLTTRESQESNVFLTNRGGAHGENIANRGDWSMTITPRLALDFSPFLAASDPDLKWKRLTMAYAPEIVRFVEFNSEDHVSHQVDGGLEAVVSDFTFQADTHLKLVDGSHETPLYSSRSSIATALVRERRDQIQDRSNLLMRYDQKKWFVRCAASLLFYDLQTDIKPATGPDLGWQNYADRYDVNGGGDFGFKVQPDFSLVASYRHGHQHQGNLFATASNSSNDYDRLLFGWEGKPLPWLKTQALFGPDFRTYSDARPLQHEANLTCFYYDLSLSAQVTSKDSLTFKAKQWEWLSGSGIHSYQDTSLSFAYHRAWNKQWETDTELKWIQNDYNAPSTVRDSLYTIHEDLGWKITAHLTVHADYSLSHGEDLAQPGTNGREFTNHQLSFSLMAAY